MDTYKNIYHLIYSIYIPVIVRERIYKYIPTGKNIHILFYEQAVYGRGTKMGKGLLDVCRLYYHMGLPFPGRVRGNILTIKRTEAKRSQEGVSGLFMWLAMGPLIDMQII